MKEKIIVNEDSPRKSKKGEFEEFLKQEDE